MTIPRLSCLFIASCLVIACGPTGKDQENAGSRRPQAIAVPTHVLTEDRAGMAMEAEAGDRIEVHLPEPSPPFKWEQQIGYGLKLAGPRAGEVRESKKRPVRVFRYLARKVGKTSLTFRLTSPKSVRPADRTVVFTVNVL